MENFNITEISEIITAVKIERSAWRTFCTDAKVDTATEHNRLRILNVVLCKLLAVLTKREAALKQAKPSKQADTAERSRAFEERWGGLR